MLDSSIQIRRRVLLAEDDPELRLLIAQALRSDGLDVIEAQNGMELLDLLGPALLGGSYAAPAELVVSDLRMPGLTGLSVLEGVNEIGWRMPFILITAFGDAETHAFARQLGAAAVLDKPFELNRLRELVRECLAGG